MGYHSSTMRMIKRFVQATHDDDNIDKMTNICITEFVGGGLWLARGGLQLAKGRSFYSRSLSVFQIFLISPRTCHPRRQSDF